jgi:hypothetical protein
MSGKPLYPIRIANLTTVDSLTPSFSAMRIAVSSDASSGWVMQYRAILRWLTLSRSSLRRTRSGKVSALRLMSISLASGRQLQRCCSYY